MPPEKILKITELSKMYGDLTAVDRVSFSIAKGEIVGLLGPNGAGKTTIISMILGLIEPTSGAIRIFDKELSLHHAEIFRRLNFAASYAQLPGNLNLRENLLIFAMLYNVPRYKAKIRELLKEFDLERFSGSRVGFLSSGEQSRLNMAKALINDPELLLLDEPTASLDPSTAEMVRARIREYVSERGAGVLWTSHDMNEIEKMCNRVLFISKGKILLTGHPRELPAKFGKKNLEELFIAIAREPLSISSK